MAQEHTRAGRFQNLIGGLVLGSIVLAYCLSPLLRFANPTSIAMGGFLVSCGLFMGHRLALVTALDRKLIWIAGGLGGLGFTILVVALSFAMENVEAFDERCETLQRVMLHGSKTQPVNGPAKAHEAFDALACRPQLSGFRLPKKVAP